MRIFTLNGSVVDEGTRVLRGQHRSYIKSDPLQPVDSRRGDDQTWLEVHVSGYCPGWLFACKLKRDSEYDCIVPVDYVTVSAGSGCLVVMHCHPSSRPEITCHVVCGEVDEAGCCPDWGELMWIRTAEQAEKATFRYDCGGRYINGPQSGFRVLPDGHHFGVLSNNAAGDLVAVTLLRVDDEDRLVLSDWWPIKREAQLA